MNQMFRAALVLGAFAVAIVPIPPAVVERLYSRSAYLALQAHLTGTSNRVPFALFDVLLVAVAAGWIGAIVVDAGRRYRWPRMLGRVAARTIVLAAASYLAFLLLWGLNYRRLPLVEKLQFDTANVSPAGARLLANVALEHANALYAAAHRAYGPAVREDDHRDDGATVDPRLAAAFSRVQRELGVSRTAVTGRPKHTLLDFYFRRAAVDGMTDPYFLEALVTRDLLPFETPFVVAHEWSHLAGYADEGEANFVGWLTCLRGGDPERYSGWLFLYGELLYAVSPADRAQLTERLDPGPRNDRRAIVDRVRRHFSARVSAVGWTVYDRYLKANHVEAGTASYAEVIRLALGARYGRDWTPLLREP
jgi:hypothetical protein